ncbi:MAG: cytochrome c oxidase assembly factor Coa1 family protein [Pirellulaceae bacterium]
MSDPNYTPNYNPNMSQPPKRSKLIWIIPIGCLGILLVCGGIGGCVFYKFYGVFASAIEEFQAAEQQVKESKEVKELFGEPISLEGEPTTSNEQDGNNVIVTIERKMSGSKQGGQMVLRARFDAQTWKMSRDELYVEADDGTRIDF